MLPLRKFLIEWLLKGTKTTTDKTDKLLHYTSKSEEWARIQIALMTGQQKTLERIEKNEETVRLLKSIDHHLQEQLKLLDAIRRDIRDK